MWGFVETEIPGRMRVKVQLNSPLRDLSIHSYQIGIIFYQVLQILWESSINGR